jgi:enterochelin esterase-like enzyme
MHSRREILGAASALALAGWAGSLRAAPPATGRLIEYPAMTSAFVDPRNVTVWLPEGYDHGTARYPVLYMHAGQNLFDDSCAGFGVEWGVDEHVTRLAAAGAIRPAIVVGIWSTPKRFREYGPAGPLRHLSSKTAKAIEATYGGSNLSDAYLRFIVSELKPRIDAAYRTLPGRKHTSVMGSSMGGLISFYALARYPDVFGGAACLSVHVPLMPLDPAKDAALVDAIAPEIKQAWRRYIARSLPRPGRNRIYMDHGTLHLDQFYAPFQEVVDQAILAKGYRRNHDFVSRAFPGTTHNERAWNDRLDIPLSFLLGQPK